MPLFRTDNTGSYFRGDAWQLLPLASFPCVPKLAGDRATIRGWVGPLFLCLLQHYLLNCRDRAAVPEDPFR